MLKDEGFCMKLSHAYAEKEEKKKK